MFISHFNYTTSLKHICFFRSIIFWKSIEMVSIETSSIEIMSIEY